MVWLWLEVIESGGQQQYDVVYLASYHVVIHLIVCNHDILPIDIVWYLHRTFAR